MRTIDTGPLWRAVCNSCKVKGSWRSTEYQAKEDLKKHKRQNPGHKCFVQHQERRERDVD